MPQPHWHYHMAVEGEVIARDFLKLEARKHQLEALQWKSVEGIRCRQSVEEVRRAASVSQLDRRLSQVEQERQRTLERNQLLREQAHLYQRQAGAQVRLPTHERGGGRSEAIEKLRDSREMFTEQVEKMAGKWHEMVEEQMKEEIKVARADATNCQVRQNEMLQAACRQEQLLQELFAERCRMQEERSKLSKIDKDMAERNRALRERLDQERKAMNLDHPTHSKSNEGAELQSRAVAAVDQGGSTLALRTEPHMQAEETFHPEKAGVQPQLASMAARLKIGVLDTESGSGKGYVPRKGTRQFEVYQRLKSYEMEMQSDLHLLEAAPLPVLLRDTSASRHLANIMKASFEPQPKPPVVFVPPPLQHECRTASSALLGPLDDPVLRPSGRAPVVVQPKASIGECDRECSVRDPGGGSRTASPLNQSLLRVDAQGGRVGSSVASPLNQGFLTMDAQGSRVTSPRLSNFAEVHGAHAAGAELGRSTMGEQLLPTPSGLDAILHKPITCNSLDQHGASLAHTMLQAQEGIPSISSIVQDSSALPQQHHTRSGGDSSTPLTADLAKKLVFDRPSDDRPLHMQVQAATPFSPSHSFELGQSGEFHISSSGGEPNLDAWIPLSSRGESSDPRCDNRSAAPRLDRSKDPTTCMLSISLQESVSFSPGLSPAGSAQAAHGGSVGALRGGIPAEGADQVSFLQSAPENFLGARHPSDTLSLSASATHTIDGSFAHLAEGTVNHEAHASKLYSMTSDSVAAGSSAQAMLDKPSEVQSGTAPPSSRSVPGSWQEHDTRPLGWGRSSTHSGIATPGSLPSARGTPAGIGEASFDAQPPVRPDDASASSGSAALLEKRPVAGNMNARGEIPFEPLMSGALAGNEAAHRHDNSSEARRLGHSTACQEKASFESLPLDKPFDNSTQRNESSFERRTSGRLEEDTASRATDYVEARFFGRRMESPTKADDNTFESRTFEVSAEVEATRCANSFETRSFDRPAESPPNSERRRDEAIAAIAGMDSKAVPAPKRSIAPWSADGGLVAALGVSELDEDELQGSDSEPAYDPTHRASRVVSSLSQQPCNAATKVDAEAAAGGRTGKAASQSAKMGIQPTLNSFDFGTGGDELSESDDLFKSQDAPNEESGSMRTPTHRKNPLKRSDSRRLGAGLGSGLLGVGNDTAMGTSGIDTTPSASWGKVDSGRHGVSDYISPAKSSSSSLAALKPKAKGASRSSVTAAYGLGDIDWSQANDPRW